jgi:hypothetical protein
MSEYDEKDLHLVCVACAADFVFTASEGRFYSDHELTLPKRCKPCRVARRLEREQTGGGGDSAGRTADAPQGR